jgi:hypothetical protein
VHLGKSLVNATRAAKADPSPPFPTEKVGTAFGMTTPI